MYPGITNRMQITILAPSTMKIKIICSLNTKTQCGSRAPSPLTDGVSKQECEEAGPSITQCTCFLVDGDLLHSFLTKPNLCRKQDEISMALFVYYFNFWGHLTPDLKTGRVKVAAVCWNKHPHSASMQPRTLYSILFFNSHSRYHEMPCHRTSPACLKATHFSLRRTSLHLSSHREGECIAFV